MGACSIDFELEGKKTFREVREALKGRQAEDAAENGHRDGYSGDFQTVHTVEDHSHKGTFKTFNEAFDYCLEHAEKWESVIAVKYESKVGERWLIAGLGAE